MTDPADPGPALLREIAVASGHLIERVIAPGRTWSPDVNATVHVLVVLSGTARFGCGPDRHVAAPRAIVTVGPWTFATVEAVDEPVRVLEAVVGEATVPVGDVLLPHAGVFGSYGIFRSLRARPHWEALVGLPWPSRPGVDPVETEAALVGFLSVLRADVAARPVPGFDWLRAAHARLSRQFRTPPLVSELAGEAGVERRKFVRLFRERYGLGPSDFVRDLRVRYARELAHRSDESPGRIAVASGFHHYQHMERAFRRSLGYVPPVLRRQRAGAR
ncbi:MAG: helix-turn-helix domain-containing protein [Gemmatimonadetes bacterium]|nr:helix-turn-helix domain-containing protein [Gemmatimonadota bacterium]